jgi:hypothetical protein
LLPHYLAAPTLVTIGGRRHLADRLRLGDFALLLQEAARALLYDADAGRLPEFADPDVGTWLASEGLPLVFWCSLHRRWPDLDLDAAFDLASRASDDEQAAVFSAAFRHGKKRPDEAAGDGVDIALLKWARVIRWFAENGKGLPHQVAEYTLDQCDLLLADHDPEARQESIEQGRLWAEWEAEHLRIHGAVKPPPAEVTLADYGWAVVPGQEIEGGTQEGEAAGDEHGDERWADDGGQHD